MFLGTSLAWQSRTIGYEFQANTDLTVVGLGYGINPAPLANASQVGLDYTLTLWDMATESALMTLVIPAGTLLEDDSTIVQLVSRRRRGADWHCALERGDDVGGTAELWLSASTRVFSIGRALRRSDLACLFIARHCSAPAIVLLC